MVYIDQLIRDTSNHEKTTRQIGLYDGGTAKKFKEVSEEISPPPGLEYNILQRLERENVKKSSSFFTGIRFIIEPN